MKWGAGREIASLDPYSYGETFTLSVLNHVYEGLVRYTGDLKIEPALAQSWETVTPTTWRKPQAIDTYDDPVGLTAEQVLELSPLHVTPLLGLPTLAAPTGLSGGVPMGVQLMGSLFQEERLFAAGAVLEKNCARLTPKDPASSR